MRRKQKEAQKFCSARENFGGVGGICTPTALPKIFFLLGNSFLHRRRSRKHFFVFLTLFCLAGRSQLLLSPPPPSRLFSLFSAGRSIDHGFSFSCRSVAFCTRLLWVLLFPTVARAQLSFSPRLQDYLSIFFGKGTESTTAFFFPVGC